MKKYILLPAMMVAAMLSTTAVKAQEDVNPLLKYVNKENNLKASIGGRMFADVAYYHTEWTPMKSGAAITDARIHASLTYGKLFIYADFGFGNGEFSQKNLFAQYTFKESLKGIHLVKAGITITLSAARQFPKHWIRDGHWEPLTNSSTDISLPIKVFSLN